MKDTPWDRALEVTGDGSGLAGHAGGILLRKLADRCGLTAALEEALTLKGTFPQLSRGMVLVSAAIAIAMGATAMAGIGVLGHPDSLRLAVKIIFRYICITQNILI